MLKTKLILLVLVIIFNVIVFYITGYIEQQRISSVLKQNINEIEVDYKMLLHHQKIIADVEQISTIYMIPRFLEIYSQLDSATEQKKAQLREELYNILKEKYDLLKTQGVLQYHFLLKDNISFLRMHKPNKFGDDLTGIREDFEYVNKTKKSISGFVQGRTAHGFRNVYPIVDKNGTHLGAMEVSFSSDGFQNFLTNVSKIHTHFIVNKHIFDVKAWKRDDLVLKYLQSSEHKDYMLAMNSGNNKQECIESNNELLAALRDQINKCIKQGKKFALYTVTKDKSVKVITFLPIYNALNGEKQALAWLVSYRDSKLIESMILNIFIIRIISIVISLLLGFLIYSQILSYRKTKSKNILVNDILNATDNIMFVTDLKSVIYSNRKFKYFFDVDNEREFNKKTDNLLLDIFIKVDGSVYKKLFAKNESISIFIKKIIEEKRVVRVLDKNKQLKTFNINIKKINYAENKDYLVTLNDITKLKKEEGIIQNKAYTDSLTGVYNRNKFDEVLASEMQRAKRYKRDFSIAILDIDFFKRCNDTYGHLIGDEVLIMLANNISNHIRSSDTFARWGGEEFVILFPETSKYEAVKICDKLRMEVEMLSHPIAGKITVSFGVSQYLEHDDKKTLFKRCDDSLYQAKESGRNRVCAI